MDTNLITPPKNRSVLPAKDKGPASDAALMLVRLVQENWIRGYEMIKNYVVRTERLEKENKSLRKDNKKLIRENHQLLLAKQQDDLTGLFTRSYMMGALDGLNRKNYDEEDRRQDGGNCLLMIDLDHFKLINDTHGHAAGDMALCVVAEALKKNIRKTDIAARVGGDEFVVILKGSSRRGAEEKVQKITKMFEMLRFEWEGVSIPVRASVGTCVIDDTKTSTDILKCADDYMFAAKRGKGAARGCMSPEDAARHA